MGTRSIIFVLIVLIAATEFFISNELLNGYLRSEINLARELKTPLDSIQEFRISKEAPFKYRLTFPAAIKGSYQVLSENDDPHTFYHVYKFWSLTFYILSACAFFWLLLQCGFVPWLGFIGTFVFLVLPPMLMAFTLPVHTREDTLAYTLFFAGLGFLVRQQRWVFFATCLVSVFTRETLLLLPLLYFFYGKDEQLIRKILISGLPILLWLAMRIAIGYDEYDVWLGLRWNLNNPDQVVGFIFITFNFLWLFFILHFLFFKRNMHFINSEKRFFYRSSVFALAIILITTFVGGIFNEIRLLNLYSPWMILFFLDCFQNYRSQLETKLRMPSYWVFAGLSLVGCGMLLYVVLSNREKLIPSGKFAVPYDQWVISSICYIFILLLFVPHLLTIISLKKPVK
jgi:hypothetical protein